MITAREVANAIVSSNEGAHHGPRAIVLLRGDRMGHEARRRGCGGK